MAITLDGTTGITTPPIILNSTVLGTATPGELEYDGKVPYFTPQGTQRGVVPGMQLYAPWVGVTGANATGAQSLFGVGATLSSNTSYIFEMAFYLSKSAGTTSHTVSLTFGGTVTAATGMFYQIVPTSNGTLTTNAVLGNFTSAFPFVVTGAITTAAYSIAGVCRGKINVSVGGTWIPQYSLSAAPGGAYNSPSGYGYVLVYPIGTNGSNISVGTWA